jgi:hypothetical protein
MSISEYHFADSRDAECLYAYTLAYKCENIYRIGPRHSTTLNKTTLSIMHVILRVNYAERQFMLSVNYAQCHIKALNVKCHYADVVMLSVIMLMFLC